MVRARDHGVSEYLAKPITATGVYYRIRSLIENNRPFIRPDFFGPDRRRRRREFEGPERRTHANCSGPDRRKEIGSFDGAERRQGYNGYKERERRKAERSGAANQEQICLTGAIDPLAASEDGIVTIPIILPRQSFDLLRDTILRRAISGVSTSAQGGSKAKKTQEQYSISDVVSELIVKNLGLPEEIGGSNAAANTERESTIVGQPPGATVRTDLRLRKELVESLRDAALARIDSKASTSAKVTGSSIKGENQHHISDIVAELVDKHLGGTGDHTAKILGSKIG